MGVCTFNSSAGKAEALCRAGDGCVMQAAEGAQWLKALFAKPDVLVRVSIHEQTS